MRRSKLKAGVAKAFILTLLVISAMLPGRVLADTYWDGKYTWNYRLSGDGVELYNPYSHDYGTYIGSSGCAMTPVASGEVVIPESIGNRKVVKLGLCLFVDCPGMTSVRIPSTVTEIGAGAFLGCTGLTEIKLPAGFKKIEYEAFAHCTNLKTVEFPSSLISLGEHAFYLCKSLHSVSFSSSLKAIGSFAFFQCDNLTLATFGSSDVTIGDRAFPLDCRIVKLDETYSSEEEEQEYSKWKQKLGGVRERTTWVTVGDEEVNWSDGICRNQDDEIVSLPYVFRRHNAILRKTAGGCRLDLLGVSLDSFNEGGWKGEIAADHELAVYLHGSNEIRVHESIGGGEPAISADDLLIFGAGSLTIYSNTYKQYSGFSVGIAAENCSLACGAAVTLRHIGWGIFANGGDFSMAFASLGLFSCGDFAIRTENCYFSGSALSIFSESKGITTSGDVVIDGCVVNSLTHGPFVVDEGRHGDGILKVNKSYLSLASYASEGTMIEMKMVSLQDCYSKLFSRGTCISAQSVQVEDGRQFFATISEKARVGAPAAIEAYFIDIMGGELTFCVPSGICINGGSNGLWNGGDLVEINSYVEVDGGILRSQDELDITEWLMFDAELAMVFSAAAAWDKVDLSGIAENFYTQVFLDAINNGLLGSGKGKPHIGISVSDGCYADYLGGIYCQTGGTVLFGDADCGILADNPIINGGSLDGILAAMEQKYGDYVIGDAYDFAYSYVNSQFTLVEKTDYHLDGAYAYSRAMMDLSGVLPAYYGTTDLYVDEHADLHLWLPAEYAERIGGGGGHGGDVEYTIEYNAGMFGSGSPVTVVKAKGVSLTLKGATFVRPGYVQTGWSTTDGGMKAYGLGSLYTTDAAMTFYPYWTKLPVGGGPAIVCETEAEYRTKADVGVVPVKVVNVDEAVKIAVKGLPGGVKFTAKDIVDKKTKAVTVPANSIYGSPTKSGVYAATVTVTPPDRKSKMAPIVKGLTFVVRNPGEHIVIADFDAAQGTVKGMGVYASGKKVTLKATAVKGWVFAGWDVSAPRSEGAAGTVSQAASWSFTMPEVDVNLTARFVTVAADKGSVALTVTAGETDIVQVKSITVKQGMYVEWPVEASALSATTVKVSGLPSGLKFTAKDVMKKGSKTEVEIPANTIYGTPKTASKTDKNGNVTPSKVKITVTTAGKAKQEYVINVTVRGIPAEGTFNGGSANGLVTLTVAKTGKISGKYLADGKTWTLSAAGFDTWDDKDRLTATLTAKSGKEMQTVALVYEDGRVASLPAPVAEDRDGTVSFEAWRNEWKVEPQKSLAAKLKGQKVTVGEDGNIVLTIGASGAVTAKGTFGSYSASCSTVLIPTESKGTYMVYLYFPPKAGKFGGWVGTAHITAE